MTECSAECKSDSECFQASKCCFDGCGLKCMDIHFTPNPFQHKPASKHIIPKIDTFKFNKGLSSY